MASHNVRRRLRLMWRSDSDPHVRQAQALVQNLVRRVGPIARGRALPLAVRQQRWPPINVPLLLAEAGAEPTNPVLNWLRACVAGIAEPVPFHGGACSATEALAVGFTPSVDEIIICVVTFRSIPGGVTCNHVRRVLLSVRTV